MNSVLKEYIKLNNLIDRMKLENFVLCSKDFGITIKPKDFYMQQYNCSPSLVVECDDFIKSNFKINKICKECVYLECLDKDMELEYHKLCIKFNNIGLKVKQ